MRRIFQEPLLHFLLIGAGLFVLYGALNEAPEAAADSRTIVVTTDDIARLQANYEQVWRRPPTDAETERLVDDFVLEEVFVREALALGLERGDAVVRQRLRQKLGFLLNAQNGALEPTEEELAAYFAANTDQFADAPLLAFEQVYLGPTPPDAAEVSRLIATLEGGADPREVGARTLLPPAIGPATPQTVDAQFGRGTFATVAAQEAGRWTGPVTTGFGAHLVRVGGYQPPRAPELAEVRDKVITSWRSDRAAELEVERAQALADRYTVRRDDQGS